jgi:hypothetical protein
MPGGRAHDPELLDALESISPRPFESTVWRVTWASRNPLVGGTGGGRWHPPNDFEALYTSLDENGAMAEAYHHLSRAPVFSSSHQKIHEVHVLAARTLVFADIASLTALGVGEEKFRRGDYSRTREIGAAARFLDIEGLIVPSARWKCANLVLFIDRLTDPEPLRAVSTRDLNWPAWRERAAREGRQ